MKVVLRQDVDNLGDKGEVVAVRPGYARNFLFPKGLALEATSGNLRTFELQKKVWMAREAKEADGARLVAAKMAALKLTITKKAGDSHTLYGSVTSSEIAELLAARGVEVDRRRIQLKDPIKTLGTFKVPVKIHRLVVAEVEIEVVPEALPEPAPETAEPAAEASAAPDVE